MSKYTEQAAELRAVMDLGKDTGMVISMVWRDYEATVHSWDAVAALTGLAPSTLRVYKHRNSLRSVQKNASLYRKGIIAQEKRPISVVAQNPLTGEWDDCEITLVAPARRGRPEKTLGAKQALLTKQLTTTQAKRKILVAQLETVDAKLTYLKEQLV